MQNTRSGQSAGWKPELTHYACLSCGLPIALEENRDDHMDGELVVDSWIKFNKVVLKNLKIDYDSLVQVPNTNATRADVSCIKCSSKLGYENYMVDKGRMWHISGNSIRLIKGERIKLLVPEHANVYYVCDGCNTYITLEENLNNDKRLLHATMDGCCIFNKVENVSVRTLTVQIKIMCLDLTSEVYCLTCHQLLGYRFALTPADPRTVREIDEQVFLFVNFLLKKRQEPAEGVVEGSGETVTPDDPTVGD